MINRRTFLVGTAGIVPMIALGSISSEYLLNKGLASVSGATMGTYFRIIFPESRPKKEEVLLNAPGTLADVERHMSTYLPDSEVSRFNNADVNARVKVSHPTRVVTEQALEIAELTGGAFDPTIGPLVELWGFGPAGPIDAVPDANSISQVAGRIGVDALRVENGQARKLKRDLAIDLNGIAKGYAVDRLAAMLEAQSASAYLIDIGGELRAKGHKPDGGLWQVGIEKPSVGAPEVHRVVALKNHGIATSGDYRTFSTIDGLKYTHVIDPRTCAPVTHSLASVTVIAEDTMTADALSTALMVMGPEEGYRFADQMNIAAYFLVREEDQFVERYTPSFKPSLMV